MPNTVTSPNMGLVLPINGITPSPTWGAALQSALFSGVDSHDHSSGKGVQIKPSGLKINADLAFGSNNATLLRSTRFSPQPSLFAAGTDIGAAYVFGNELYYRDLAGNNVQITNNGVVNAAGGGASTTTTGGFNQPAVGSTQAVGVASASGAVLYQGATINGVNQYIVTNIAGLNVTFLNMGGANNVSATTPIASGVAVVWGGVGFPVTNKAPGEGQALVATGGNYSPAGISIVLNARSGYGGLVAQGNWNGTTGADDTAALQAWLDSVQPASGGVCYLPETSTKATLVTGATVSIYKISAPLSVCDSFPTRSWTGNSVYEIAGAGASRVGIDSRSYAGPTFIVGYAESFATYTTESNGIVSMHFGANANKPWLNLGELWFGDIGGLTAFTFRMWYLTNDGPNVGDQWAIAGSFGNTGLESHTAFALNRTDFVSANFSATLAVKPGILTGTPSLTFSASAHTITRSTGSWVTDGFATGQSYFVTNTALNNGTPGTIASVSATVLTFSSGVHDEGPLTMPAGAVWSEVTLTASAPDLTTGVWQQLMVTYDGLTLRLFVAGTLVASSSTLSATAPIAQRYYEEFVIGQGGFTQWPSAASAGHFIGSDSHIGLIRLDKVCAATATFTPNVTADSTGVLNQTIILIDFAPANRPTRQSQGDFIIGRTWTVTPGNHSLNNAPAWIRMHTSNPSVGFTYTGGTKIHDFTIDGYGAGLYYISHNDSTAYNLTVTETCNGLVYDSYSYPMTVGPDINFVGCIGSMSGWSANVIFHQGAQFYSIRERVGAAFGLPNWHVLQAFGDLTITGSANINGLRQGVYAFNGTVIGQGLGYDDEGSNYQSCGVLLMNSPEAQLNFNTATHQSSRVPMFKIYKSPNTLIRGQLFVGSGGNSQPVISYGSNQNDGNPVVFRAFNAGGDSIVDTSRPGPVVVGDQETYGVNTLAMPGDADYAIPTNGELWGTLVVTCASLGGTVSLTNGTASITFSASQTLANATPLVFSLPGTASVANNSTSVTFSTSQTTTGAATIVFASQPGIVYTTTGALSGTSGTLTAAYTGPTNTATGMTYATVYTLSGAVSGTSGTLNTTYAGTTNATATTTYALTAMRNIKTPYHVAGKRWRIQNYTMGGQSITLIGTSGAGYVVPIGTTVGVRDDGTNLVAA